MSFSGKVKEELLEHYARARHCDIAELSAIVHMAGEFKVGHGGVCCLKVHTENLGVARKCFTLLVKTFNIKTDVVVRRNTGKDTAIIFTQKVKNCWRYVTRSCRQSAVKGHI